MHSGHAEHSHVHFSSSSVPATAGVDFSNSPVQAVFGPGDSVMSVEIPITVDSFIEMLEFFEVVATLGASAPANAQIVSPDQATVFIIDGTFALVTTGNKALPSLLIVTTVWVYLMYV